MRLSSTVLIIIAIVVVVLIVIVVGAVRLRIHATASVGKSPSPSGSDSRHSAQGPMKPLNNEELKGPIVNASNEQPQPAGVPFPRHAAKAGNNPDFASLKVNAPTAKYETVFVESVAELFSAKEDIEAELGVTQEEFDKMVEARKKSKEVSERPVPVSRYFNLDKYTESRQTLKASAINAGMVDASKRGKIVASIYRKYGNKLGPRSYKSNANVMAALDTEEDSARVIAEANADRSHGHLEVR